MGDPRGENWTESVRTLSGRGDEETYQAAAAWCAGPDPVRQAFAVDVLAGLGFPDGPGPFAARSLPLLRELAARAEHPDLVQSLLAALAAYGDADAVEDVLRHAAHPSPAVRARVADALHGLVRDDGTAAAEALVTLAADPDPKVRARTATALAGLAADSPEIRDALAALLHTGDAETAVEAARGLARRGDPRAADALAAVLEEQPQDSPAYTAALDAIDLVADPDAARTLRAAARRAASR
nr:HEAT repeat domain-containing protein [Streptomyces sp. GC420]